MSARFRSLKNARRDKHHLKCRPEFISGAYRLVVVTYQPNIFTPPSLLEMRFNCKIDLWRKLLFADSEPSGSHTLVN